MYRETGLFCIVLFLAMMGKAVHSLHYKLKHDRRKPIVSHVQGLDTGFVFTTFGFVACAMCEVYYGRETKFVRAMWECFFILGIVCTILAMHIVSSQDRLDRRDTEERG